MIETVLRVAFAALLVGALVYYFAGPRWRA